MRKEFIFDEREMTILRHIVNKAIIKNNNDIHEGINPATGLLFNQQELAQAEEMLK